MYCEFSDVLSRWSGQAAFAKPMQSLPAFTRHLKTHFFQSAYPTP